MLCKGYKTTYHFAQFKSIPSFGDAIRNDVIATNDVTNDEQQQLTKKIR